MKASTVQYLVGNDPQAADDILSHNEHGEKVGAWKANP